MARNRTERAAKNSSVVATPSAFDETVQRDVQNLTLIQS